MNSTTTATRGLALLLLAVMVAGCGGLFGQKNDEPVQSYMFAPREFRQIGDVDAEVILLVAPVQSVGHDHLQMTYTLRPYERTHYAFSRWADTPPRMVEPLVVQAMEASGLFKAVVDVTSSVPAEYRLDLDLLVLQHEFHTDPSQGRMVIRGQLNHIDGNRIIGTRLFQATAPAPSENAYGGVLAINLALESILADMAAWVHESVTRAEAGRMAEE
jgi:cholesterol transport system auxiliary component